MVIISSEILAELVSHAKEDAPLEACGLLAGIGSVVKKIYRLTNVDGSCEHFSLDPKEQFAAVKDMRAEGLEMLAVYHSHPASPARMSDEDLRLALTPDIEYMIISLMNSDHPEVKSFRMVDGLPVEEGVLIQESEE